jgi:hypothetical protein
MASATCYLTEPKPLTINLLTNYMDVLHWCLNFAPQTRAPRTPAKSSGLSRLPSRRQFVCVNPLTATLMSLPASVANKRLTARLTPLTATLTKNAGGRGASCLSPHSHVHSCPLFSCGYGNPFCNPFIFKLMQEWGGWVPLDLAEAPLEDFNLRLLTAPRQGTPLLSSTSHQSPVTSHLQ